ncbi:MAG: hypothetical protein AB7S26_34830 [Sandaracinaceae bacterium]
MPAVAHARVDCSGGALAPQVRAASTIFVGRLEAAGTVAAPVPSGHRGSPDAYVTFVVTRVLKGSLQVGDRVRVRWEGWSEPEDGEIVGGCRVPGTEAGETYPMDMLVLASGSTDDLRVPNRSRSTRVIAANRELVREVARLSRRTR